MSPHYLQFFPSSWKTARVVIIGKPNKPTYESLSSLRSISLVNGFANILEKIVVSRLSWFAHRERWLSPNQHGFVPGKSTDSAGHSLVSAIEATRGSKMTTACAFLDIKSAFDAAWHPAILSALARRACSLYLICLGSCFLADRTAVLSGRGTTATYTVNLGCPQGGVLSPFLWTVLIDDVLKLSFPFPHLIIGYAYDLTVTTFRKDPELWAPLLTTKSGVRGARVAQRPYLITATRAFRSVSTEALLVTSNTLPLDLRAAEMTSRRYGTCPDEDFWPSTLRWLSGVHQDLVYPSGSITCPASLSVPPGPPGGGGGEPLTPLTDLLPLHLRP